MKSDKYVAVENMIESLIPNYKKYLETKNELLSTSKDDKNYDILSMYFGLLKFSIIKQVKSYMYDRGIKVNFDMRDFNSAERAVEMLKVFTLSQTYYKAGNIPYIIKTELIDEYEEDCLNAYMKVFNLCKNGMIDNDELYSILFNCFTSIYDMTEEVYKENDVIGLINYVSILDNFKIRDGSSAMLIPLLRYFDEVSKNDAMTHISSILLPYLSGRKDISLPLRSLFNDERFKNYILYLTANRDLLMELNSYDLYLILKYFNSNEFLELFDKTNGMIINDIAKIIIRRKKEGISEEVEEQQIKSLSNNLNQIKENHDVISL